MRTPAAIFQPKNAAILGMGIASGLPLALSGSTLQAWLFQSGVSLQSIGLASFIGLPYALKFLWAPFADHPSVRCAIERRLQVVAIAIVASVCLGVLSFVSPTASPAIFVGLLAVMVFASASLDIVIDGLRAEIAEGSEIGPAVSSGVLGYRIGMLLSGAGGLVVASHWGFPIVYRAAAVLLLVFAMSALALRSYAARPQQSAETSSLLEPFTELVSRPKIFSALLFVLLYKAGDQLAGGMAIPFLLTLGVTEGDLGQTVQTTGMAALITGSVIAGICLSRISLGRALVLFGVLQMISTGGYAMLALTGSAAYLVPVIAIEHFCAGVGTAALLAFLVALCDLRFSASQYALLTSVVALGRIGFEVSSGFVAAAVGWPIFFTLSILLALPGLAVCATTFPEWTRHTIRREVVQ